MKTPILNGNKFVKCEHLFVPDDGTYFPTEEIAHSQAYSYNGVGMWAKQIEFGGKAWFQSGYTNCFD